MGGRPIALVAWMILLVAVAIGAAPLVPPGVPVDPGPADFSTARATELIGRLALEPHSIGTPAIERVRATIVAELRGLGLEPELQAIEAPSYYLGTDGPVAVVNVMARIPGSASTGAVALVGHYDTAPGTPGANDDSSAVAILLESARAVLAGPTPRNDLILLFTDGEEPAPRYGSSAFVAQHPWLRDIGLVINLETLGATGPSLLIGVSEPDAWIVDQYAEAAPHPVAFSYLTSLARMIGGSNTDFATFRGAGIAGLEFAYLHGSPIYHTPSDVPESVNPGSLQQQGANTLAVARHLAGLDLGIARDAGNLVYFTIGNHVVVRYPAGWSILSALLAGAALTAAAWRGRGRGRGRGRFLRSLGGTLLATIIAAVAAAVGWMVLASSRPTMGVAESYLYLAGLVAMTAGIAAVLTRLLQSRPGPDPLAVLAVWWGLALLAGATVPGISYLFAWPTLAGALVLLSRSRSPQRVGSGARAGEGLGVADVAGFALVAVVTLALLVPAIDTFYQLAQPRPGNTDSEILGVVVIPVVLTALVVELLRAVWVRPASADDG